MSRGNPRTLIGVIAMLSVVIAAGTPVLAQAGHGSSFGGGGGGHSGGGHSSGGGHYSGGGGGGHSMAAPHYAAPHFAGGYAGSRGSYSAPHTYAAPRGNFVAAGARYAAPRYGHRSPAYASGWHGGTGGGGYVGHGYYGRGGFGHRPYWGGGYWGGGYWGGGYWPHVYYGPGFAWFLPILPLGYATFWWGGLPYYYWNDVYYTWRPDYDGYVVTDPPPVADSASADDNGDDSGSGGTADVYIYPRNGQSDEQTANDRYECHKWAVGQTGFDPTRSSQASGTASEYRRAMIACLGARGYSAK